MNGVCGYSFKHHPRVTGEARGGTGIFYRDNFEVSKTGFGQKRSFEYSEWVVSWSNNNVKLCVVYHQSRNEGQKVSNKQFLEDLSEYLEDVVLSKEKLVLLGDFNIHVDDFSDTSGIELRELLFSLGLVNHVWFPTHNKGHTLDLIVTRNNDEIVLTTPTAGYFISDRCFVNTRLKLPRPELRLETVKCRKVKSMDFVSFKSELASVCTELISIEDPKLLAAAYNEKLRECLDDHAPITTKSFLVRPKVPWYDPCLKDLKRIRRKHERAWEKCKSDDELKSLFQQARNKYGAQLCYNKTHYFSGAVNSAKGDQKKLYSIISSLTVVKNSNPLPPHSDVYQLAQDFGNTFVNKIDNIRKDIEMQTIPHPPSLPQTTASKELSNFVPLTDEQVREMIFKCKSASCDLDPIPTDLLKQCIDILLPVLTKMINLSLSTGIFPDAWKLALVIPLIKKLGLELIFNNYRPVSNLPFVSKLAERAVIDQESTHMSSNCPLPDNSSAYQQYHSTESALL